MSDQANHIQEIFVKRLALVGELSQLNAEQLRNTQKLSGNQIDLLRCQDQLEDGEPSDDLRAELAEAEAHIERLQIKINACNEQIQIREEKLAALDRKLEEF
jgi:peptidoglycan hydrolase CwlO-like protein